MNNPNDPDYWKRDGDFDNGQKHAKRIARLWVLITILLVGLTILFL